MDIDRNINLPLYEVTGYLILILVNIIMYTFLIHLL